MSIVTLEIILIHGFGHTVFLYNDAWYGNVGGLFFILILIFAKCHYSYKLAEKCQTAQYNKKSTLFKVASCFFE